MTYIQKLHIDKTNPLPLATQLSRQLWALIASGIIKNSEKLPPIRNLSHHLGINIHTIRAAYKQLEDDGIVVTRQGAGTIVLNLEERQQHYRKSTSPTFTIGVLIPWISSFYAPFQRGILEVAQEGPYLVYMCDTKLAGHTLNYVDQMIAKNVDGIIIISQYPFPEINEKGKATLPNNLPPIVFAAWPTSPPPSILFNSENGAFKIVTHLIEHGHKRIGLIAPSITLPSTTDIYKGYKLAMHSAKLDIIAEDIMIVSDWTKEAGFKGATHLLDLPNPPRAIFAFTDELAIGAMKAIKSRGLRIPEDIAIVGHGEIELSEYMNPPLTTVSLPAYEMGKKSMQMLQNLIDGEILNPTNILLETKLIIRKTCGC